MKAMAPLTAVWLVALARLATSSMVEQIHYLVNRDVTPNMPWDLNTISTCTYWYDNYGAFSCLDVRTSINVTAQAFTRWNPSITLSCGNWNTGFSYCVEVRSEQIPSSTATTSTGTSTSTTSSTPKPTPTWTALGCYLDGQPRTFSNQSAAASGGSLTTAKCQAACWAQDFRFAGLEAGNQCWCGNYVGNEKTPNQADCHLPCSGAASETCGGTNLLSVYQADATSPPTQGWQALGCYVDVLNPRTLENQRDVPGGTPNMTIAACQAACLGSGYSYAGVEYAQECWCDNAIQGPTQNIPAASTDCNMACTGNPAQVCGGPGRINVYESFVGTPPPPPPATTSRPATSTSRAATTTSRPTNSPTPTSTNWSNLGCYLDLGNPRTLGKRIDVQGGAGNTTIAGCQATCLAAGYSYAGVEFARECWCDSAIRGPTTNTQVALTDCNMPCAGDASQMCGAGNRIGLYHVIPPSAPVWVPLGCYVENDPRLLRNKGNVPGGDGNQTVENCVAACDKGGYVYAGVQFARECWCDNVINPPGAMAPDGGASCNMPCTGQPAEMCGGTSRLNILIKSTQL